MTFFSGTDLDTLRKEGNDTIHFVSLIVNNAGNYTAAITNKVTNTINSNIKTVVKSFNNEESIINSTEEEVKDIIQYSMLDIEIEKNDELEELNDRINEIKTNKSSRVNDKFKTFNSPSLDNFSVNGSYNSYSKDKNNQKSLWEDDDWNYNSSREMIDNYREIKKEEKSISKDKQIKEYDEYFSSLETMSDSMVKKLITCNILVTDKSKIELDKWIKNIDSVYPKIFKNVKNFEYYAEAYIDCILHYMFPIDDIEDEDNRGYDISMLCETVIQKLEKLIKNNKYIDAYIDVLTTYTL